jgi:hypothetical protein
MQQKVVDGKGIGDANARAAMEGWYCMTVVNSTISPVFVMSWPPVRPQLPVLGGTSVVPTIDTMLATKSLLTVLSGILPKATVGPDRRRSGRTTIA